MSKAKTLLVTATSAAKPCPMYPRKMRRMYEHTSGDRRDRTMIYSDEVIEVENNRFYRRRIQKGDLKEAAENPPPKPKAPSRAATAKPTGDSK